MPNRKQCVLVQFYGDRGLSGCLVLTSQWQGTRYHLLREICHNKSSYYVGRIFFTSRKCPRISNFLHLSYHCLKHERNLNLPFIKKDLTCLLFSLKYCLSLSISVCIYCFRILYWHLQMPSIFRYISVIAEFLVGREIRERLNGNWSFLFFTHSSEKQLRPCLKGKCSTCLSVMR